MKQILITFLLIPTFTFARAAPITDYQCQYSGISVHFHLEPNNNTLHRSDRASGLLTDVLYRKTHIFIQENRPYYDASGNYRRDNTKVTIFLIEGDLSSVLRDFELSPVTDEWILRREIKGRCEF